MDSAISSGQDEIEPLTGNPYFSCIISKSHVGPAYQMLPPKKFVRWLPSSKVPVVLHCRSKSWEMCYYGNQTYNKLEGWKKFAVDNNLEFTDAVIFELMDSKNLHFKVQILKGRILHGADPDAEGWSSTTPIVID